MSFLVKKFDPTSKPPSPETLARELLILVLQAFFPPEMMDIILQYTPEIRGWFLFSFPEQVEEKRLIRDLGDALFRKIGQSFTETVYTTNLLGSAALFESEIFVQSKVPPDSKAVSVISVFATQTGEFWNFL